MICKPTDRASVLLGSIKAACSLEDIFKTLSVKVTVVVTMCANEMEIRGAPKDWARYFPQEKVFHIKCHLEDTTLKPPHRWEERIPDLVALFGTVENCLWPTLETIHAGSDQGRIHARALPLLWRHRSKRWGFMMCLARRGLQLLCRGCRPVAAWEKTFLAPLAQSPLCLNWRLCGSWKVCVPSGTWNWVRRAEINLHHYSSGETVRGEPAKSVANCCLFVQLKSVDLHVFVWSNSMTDDLILVRVNNYMHDRAIWNFRGGSCASLVPAWVFDGCFWSWSKSNYWNVSSAVLCTKVGTSEPRRFTAISKHHFLLVCVVKASACKSACV